MDELDEFIQDLSQCEYVDLFFELCLKACSHIKYKVYAKLYRLLGIKPRSDLVSRFHDSNQHLLFLLSDNGLLSPVEVLSMASRAHSSNDKYQWLPEISIAEPRHMRDLISIQEEKKQSINNWHDFRKKRRNKRCRFSQESWAKIIENDSLSGLSELFSNSNFNSEVLQNMLSAAVSEGAIQCFRFLIINGGEIEKTLCEDAIVGRNMEILQIISEAFPSELNQFPEMYMWNAIDFLNFPVIRYFIDQDLIDQQKALLNGINYFCLPLLSHLFLKDQSLYSQSIYTFNSELITTFHYAVLTENYPVVDFLIEKGIDIDTTTQSGLTALHIVCLSVIRDSWNCVFSFDRESNITRLIGLGADVNKQTLTGQTPLHFAKGEKMVSILFENGADPYIRNANGVSPLEYWNEIQCKEILDYLNTKGISSLTKAKEQRKSRPKRSRETLPLPVITGKPKEISKPKKYLLQKPKKPRKPKPQKNDDVSPPPKLFSKKKICWHYIAFCCLLFSFLFIWLS